MSLYDRADVDSDGISVLSGTPRLEWKVTPAETRTHQRGEVCLSGMTLIVLVLSRVMVEVRCRYFATDDFQMYMPNADVPVGVSPLDEGSYFNCSGESHNAMVGLRVTI